MDLDSKLELTPSFRRRHLSLDRYRLGRLIVIGAQPLLLACYAWRIYMRVLVLLCLCIPEPFLRAGLVFNSEYVESFRNSSYVRPSGLLSKLHVRVHAGLVSVYTF